MSVNFELKVNRFYQIYELKANTCNHVIKILHTHLVILACPESFLSSLLVSFRSEEGFPTSGNDRMKTNACAQIVPHMCKNDFYVT